MVKITSDHGRLPPTQLYVHVPFCERKCHYCDFASWESPAITQIRWLEIVLGEIELSRKSWEGTKIKTVFFGGGTPSLLPLSSMEKIVRRLKDVFDFSQVVEMTLEVNPSSLNNDKLQCWRELGFVRVSLGVQSFDPEELKLLGRVHTPETALSGLELLASESGLSFSGDLIFGIPGQTRETFLKNLEILLQYQPGHVSFYGLTVEEGTLFDRWQSEGRLKLPDGDLYRDSYCAGVDFLKTTGYSRYEVSNFSRPGLECLHNQGYWRGASYLAFGPGAHSYDGLNRWMNPFDLEAYLKWGNEGFSDSGREWDELNPEARLTEDVFLGLRQAKGFSPEILEKQHGFRWREKAFSKWEGSGLLIRDQDRVRLTDEGWILLDEIVVDLLAHVRPVNVG